MDHTELDIGGPKAGPRARPRRAVAEALERLLRAHVAFRVHREREGLHDILRPARETETDMIQAVFGHCGVPLPDSLLAIYRRTLGVGNPVSPLPVLSVPFLRAALPDEGFGHPVVGLATFEEDLGLYRDEPTFERPPFLPLGQAGPLGLTVSRNGLWSLKSYAGQGASPEPQDFRLIFEAAFPTYVDQTVLLWANDLAGDLVRIRDLDVTQGVGLAAMPAALLEARDHLLVPRSLTPRTWGEVEPLDHPDLLRAGPRSEGSDTAAPLGSATAIVGLPYGGFALVAGRIGLGTLLRLQPVHDNPYDPNAVEVWYDDEEPVRVGFVERQDAPNYRALPDGPSAWRLRVTDRSEHALLARLERFRPASAVDDTDASGPKARAEGDHDLFRRRG
ncbi:hypothetical protein FHG66_13980 [Rubellimicrobium rubrum]|uniref:Uncharacterized protein n=1 Tax=Rubellimicrobium rubrum TaxID=2585369 RepID=A0A5C4MWG1_9RHOB|nr:hypothetical protein [Rubellimicrobium rubrum]TNC48457.1 hypothetical protein FHG66_13980 [Rubellimicrobium rubrum]